MTDTLSPERVAEITRKSYGTITPQEFSELIASHRALERQLAEARQILSELVHIPAVVQVLGATHTPNCKCAKCRALAALDQGSGGGA